MFVLVGGLLLAACSGVDDGDATTAPFSVAETTTAIQASRPELPDGFDVEGHRGARRLSPENTAPSFEIALDLGVSTLELDLHFSADGVVVVWHDRVIDQAKCGVRTGAPEHIPDPDDPETTEEALAVRSLTSEDLG
jgi:hypothetical protein